MNSSRYAKQQLKYLALLLHTSTDRLKQTLTQSETLYKEWEKIKINKRTGEVKYKDGKPATRELKMAIGTLYELQNKIKKYLLSSPVLPDCVHGCVKGRSNITNAKAHQGKKYKFTTDLCKFYDTINAEKVYYVFIRLGYNSTLAHWLTELTTKNNAVPQGASTSNHLQNLVFKPTDNFLMMICKKYNITYTRFVDDLTFSSATCFKDKLPEIVQQIVYSGFKINNRKTK